jgi:tRNA(fMet)-specific endonuclease VapC
LFDTNAVIALLKGNPVMVARLREHAPVNFGIPAIAAHELYFGASKSARSIDNLARIGRLRIPVVDFDREDAIEAGRIRAALAAAGTPIGPYDVLIAGQAKARDLILITCNTREFLRVGGLRVQNWESDDPTGAE